MESMNPEKLLLKITPILDKLKIDYFITGGFAVSVWGRPRATFDIDIVVKLIEPKIEPLAKLLKQVSKAGYVDEDVARQAVRQKGEFNFIDSDTGLKVDFWIEKDDMETKEQFKRRIAKKINNKRIYFISPEDLILNKLKWYNQTESDRHLEDIDSIFKISGKKLDKKYLKQRADRFGFSEIINKYL
jgi:hypothetical protein